MTASTSQADELTYFLLRFHLGLGVSLPISPIPVAEAGQNLVRPAGTRQRRAWRCLASLLSLHPNAACHVYAAYGVVYIGSALWSA